MAFSYLDCFDLSEFLEVVLNFLLSNFFIDSVDEYLEVRIVPSFVDEAVGDLEFFDLTDLYN
jgi:hypothetical protein